MERIGAEFIGIPLHSHERWETLKRGLKIIKDSSPTNYNIPIILCLNGADSRQAASSFEEHFNVNELNLTIVRSLDAKG